MKWKKLTQESLIKLKSNGSKFLVYNPQDRTLHYNIVFRFDHGEWLNLNICDEDPDISYYDNERLVETFTHYTVLDRPTNTYEV